MSWRLGVKKLYFTTKTLKAQGEDLYQEFGEIELPIFKSEASKFGITEEK